MRKKKQSSIRTRILVPFIATIITMPVVILIVFHIFMNIYIKEKAVNELENIFQTTTALIDNQVIENAGNDNNTDAKQLLKELKAVLTAARMTGNTSFYIFNEEMELVYPAQGERKPLDPELGELLRENQSEIVKEIPVELAGSHGKYYAAGRQLVLLDGKLVLNMMMVNEQRESYELLTQMDYIFVMVALAATMIGTVIAFYVAYGISRATKKLCENAKEIGGGNFIQTEPENENVKEIMDLYLSLNEMSNRLKQYDETQKSFLQNVSHELRTPLMSIQGYAEGIEYHVLDDVEHAAGIIGNESRRMTAMVEELLTLSRLETETIHVNMQEFELNELLTLFVERMKGLTLLENVEIQFFPSERNYKVFVDEVLLSQAVTNIVGNGVRHAKARVVLKAESMGYVLEGAPKGCFVSGRTAFSMEEMVRIYIWDDGEGFAEEDIPYIFERFYKGKGGKFGIGLAIAKSSVEKMGGQILAYNQTEEGKGACFEIRLPVLACG